MIYDLYCWYHKGNTQLDRSCFTWASFVSIMADRPDFSIHYRNNVNSYNMYYSEALGMLRIFDGSMLKHTPGLYDFGGGKL